MPADASVLVGAAALFVTVELAVIGGIWKLATMLGEVRGEVRHNGGSSLKDNARDGAESAKRAVVLADEARSQASQARAGLTALAESVAATNADRDHKQREADTTLALVAARDERIREILTQVLTGQEQLTARVDELAAHTTIVIPVPASSESAAGSTPDLSGS